MLHIQHFSTDGHLPRQRLEYWNELTSETLTEQIAEPADPLTFCDRIRRTNLGDVGIAKVTATASVVTHSKAHVSHSREALYIVRLPIVGPITIQQGGRESRLSSGDFSLCDASRPYKLLMGRGATVLTLRIPRARLTRYIAFPEAVASTVIAANSAAGGLTSRFLQDLWRSTDQMRAPDAARRYGEIALQLIASSYAELPRAGLASTTVASMKP